MNAAEWTTCADPRPMLVLLQKRGCTERKLHLFGCACCRRIWELMQEKASRRAVELAERFADGIVPFEELKAAADAAQEAARLPWKYPPVACPPVGCWYAARAAVSDGPTARGVDVHVLTADMTAWSAAAAVATATIRWHDPEWEQRMRAAWLRFNEDIADRWDDFFWDAAYDLGWDAFVDLPGWAPERAQQAALLRDLFGDPCVPPPRVEPSWVAWNGRVVRHLAASIYEERTFERLPILADALEEAGCDSAELLRHCRGKGPHARGCFVLDLLLGHR